jgi:hypothetical protein
METIVEYAQLLVYNLLDLMPSVYQKASFNALLGLFLNNFWITHMHLVPL